MSYEVHNINAKHNDLIHDVAYDYYGHRMATCSSDQYVKIWDQDKFGNWNLSSAWKAHSGSVWKVTWCHPEFGQVIATCSFDRTACIWEEVVEQNIGEGPLKRWTKKANLVDSRTSVTDVKFGPRYLGLYLTTCSADGTIRIYEAPDVMNLSQWTQQHEVSFKPSCSCLTWTNSFNRFHIPLIAVGSDDNNTSVNSKIAIYEYNEQSRRMRPVDAFVNVMDAVHDIVFAPTLGRSFHLLAVATKNVKIIKLKPIVDVGNNVASNSVSSASSSTVTSSNNSSSGVTTPGAPPLTPAGRYDVTVVGSFDDHYYTVWRVSWNVLGTVLASSGDDGCVRLWKCYRDNWECVNVLKGDGIMSSADLPIIPVATAASVPTTTPPPPAKARYLKLGSISHPSQNDSMFDQQNHLDEFDETNDTNY